MFLNFTIDLAALALPLDEPELVHILVAAPIRRVRCVFREPQLFFNAESYLLHEWFFNAPFRHRFANVGRDGSKGFSPNLARGPV